MPNPDTPALALQELAHRRRAAARALAQCRTTPAQAEGSLLYWAAIAARTGATLPDDIARQVRPCGDGEAPAWWDFTPRGEDPTLFMRRALEELQRATGAAIIRHDKKPCEQSLARARRLIALHRELAAPILGPLPLAEPEPLKEAA